MLVFSQFLKSPKKTPAKQVKEQDQPHGSMQGKRFAERLHLIENI